MNTRNRESGQAKRQGPSLLDEVLERRMLLYALAAGATLAGASAAQAKVVFTPSHAVLRKTRNEASIQIDLSNDGVYDFSITSFFIPYSSTYGVDALGKQPSDLIVTYPSGGLAKALKRGNSVGRGPHFMNFASMGSIPFGDGYFPGTTDRFLGVKFRIDGQVHYGWIGFRSFTKNLTATFGGWAYETDPNTPIIAGDTGRGDSDSSALQAGPTSLELLAAGHVAIAERRRRIAA
jgi:hypothetical protein